MRMVLEQPSPPDERVALLAAAEELGGGLEVGVVAPHCAGDGLGVRSALVHGRLLQREHVEAAEVRFRPHRGKYRVEAQPQQDVPRADPHPLIVPAILPTTEETIGEAPFIQLDYLYTPSDDVAADARYFADVLGGRLAFAIEGMGTRVAMVELTDGPPHVLLTDHLEGDRPIYIYRVPNLRRAVAQLKKRGLQAERRVEIPMGPCSSFTTPGGHRLAVYEPSRPEVLEHFLGRRDF